MTHKLDRMSREISREVSLIVQNKLGNPNISPFSTITDVILSKDIKYALVYVIVPDPSEVESTIKALNASAGFIRRELSKTLRELRTVPALRFREDNSKEYGCKIDSILKSIKYGDEE